MSLQTSSQHWSSNIPFVGPFPRPSSEDALQRHACLEHVELFRIDFHCNLYACDVPFLYSLGFEKARDSTPKPFEACQR